MGTPSSPEKSGEDKKKRAKEWKNDLEHLKVSDLVELKETKG